MNYELSRLAFLFGRMAFSFRLTAFSHGRVAFLFRRMAICFRHVAILHGRMAFLFRHVAVCFRRTAIYIRRVAFLHGRVAFFECNVQLTSGLDFYSLFIRGLHPRLFIFSHFVAKTQLSLYSIKTTIEN